MAEKFSERHLRIEKVRKIKEKVFREIAHKETLIENTLIASLSAGRGVHFNVVESSIERLYVLKHLVEFLQDESTFMQALVCDLDVDAVIYQVSDEKLNIILQDDFDFVGEFLSTQRLYGCNFAHMLTEKFFANEFISVMEMALYRQRQEDESRISSEER